MEFKDIVIYGGPIVSSLIAYVAIKKASKKEDASEIHKTVDLKLKIKELELKNLEIRVDSIEQTTKEIHDKLEIVTKISVTIDMIEKILPEIQKELKAVNNKMLTKYEHKEIHKN